MEPFLLEMLAPLRGNGEQLAAFILDSVRQVDVGVLGSVGVLSLLYSSVSLLDKVEDFSNHIWRKRAKSARGLLRRFSDYLGLVFVGPLLIISAFGGMSGIIRRLSGFSLIEGVSRLIYPVWQTILPSLFIVVTFAFLYQVIPNARVKFRSALFGGVLAGLSWKLAGWIFAAFVAGSAQYHAVYSTFAFLILFILWLYLSWLVFLLGVQVTFFHQHPRYMDFRADSVCLSIRLFERLGLVVMLLMGRRFIRGEPPWSLSELSEKLELPDDCIGELLSILSGKGFIMRLGRESEIYVPARELSAVKLMDLLDALRSAHEKVFLPAPAGLAEPAVDWLLERQEAAMRRAWGDTTIRDLVGEQFGIQQASNNQSQ